MADTQTSDAAPVAPADGPIDLDAPEIQVTTQDAPTPEADGQETPETAEAQDGEQQDAGEDTAGDQPTIDAPRSWATEDKEAFKALPRGLQERIAERERERERQFRLGQDEVAKGRKAAEDEMATAKQLRQQYEAALPAAIQAQFAALQKEFPEIKGPDALQKLEKEDWRR